jgi:hypothetical protein
LSKIYLITNVFEQPHHHKMFCNLAEKSSERDWAEIVFCSGTGILQMTVTYSSFHWAGHSQDCTILFIILEAGVASSGANSLMIVLGMSPGTPDWGFFADIIPLDYGG